MAALIGWWVWAWVTYIIGTRLLPGPHRQADHRELLRTLGFSSAPGTLRIFALVPQIAGPVFLLTTLWMLVAMVMGVRQALDYHNEGDAKGMGAGRALLVCALGFPVYATFLAASLLLLGPWPV